MHQRTYLRLRARAEPPSNFRQATGATASVVEGHVLTLAWPLVRSAAIITPPMPQPPGDPHALHTPHVPHHPGR
jgi:hypothetical protein